MIAFAIFEQSPFVFALFFAIYCNFVGNFNTSTYSLPLKMAAPFNIESIFKWYLFWAFQFICGIAYLCGTVIPTVYFVCCCFYIEALCEHFDHFIESIDAEFRQNQDSLDAHKILIKAVNHHNKIYEWVYLLSIHFFPIVHFKSILFNFCDFFRVFDMLADINSGTIFAFLVMSAPYLGISYYNLEHVIKKIESKLLKFDS